MKYWLAFTAAILAITACKAVVNPYIAPSSTCINRTHSSLCKYQFEIGVKTYGGF